ncbi:hypothetical protein AYI69_g7457 [Smittium culicis]|uniref:Uncharacterized protein n=1 Tax=Smittium culicis TaxID=133412 RepID=A0A1R1XRX0_9FUNG|nr:hypothetical protein AYI69_g7457 [Smittium culicis]
MPPLARIDTKAAACAAGDQSPDPAIDVHASLLLGPPAGTACALAACIAPAAMHITRNANLPQPLYIIIPRFIRIRFVAMFLSQKNKSV